MEKFVLVTIEVRVQGTVMKQNSRMTQLFVCGGVQNAVIVAAAVADDFNDDDDDDAVIVVTPLGVTL